jgi:hypothetical protein
MGGPMARMRDGESPLARPHGKRRGPRRPWGLILFFALFVLLVGTGIAARISFALVAPHAVSPPVARLSQEKRAQLDEELDYNRPFDRDQAIDFALDYTAQSLSFSPASGRAASFDFGVGKRKASCEEYAALFVAVFEAASKRAGSTARAWRVRSQARVFDKVIPLKGYGDHDWILVHDPADGARIYLDPTLYDLWLGSTVTRNVKGGAAIPLPPPTADDSGKPATAGAPK